MLSSANLPQPSIFKNKLIQFLERQQNFTDLPNEKLLHLLKQKASKCQSCHLHLEYYCIEPKCSRNELICLKCSFNNIESIHFAHSYTFIFPLFMKSICSLDHFNQKTLQKLKETVDQHITQYTNLLQIYHSLQRQLNYYQQLVQELIEPCEKFKRQFISDFIDQKDKQTDLNALFKGNKFQFHHLVKDQLKKVFGLTKEVLEGTKQIITFSSEIQLTYKAVFNQYNSYFTFQPFYKGNQPYVYTQQLKSHDLMQKYLFNDFKDYGLTLSLPVASKIDEIRFLSMAYKFTNIKILTLNSNNIFHFLSVLDLPNLQRLKFCLHEQSQHFTTNYEKHDLSIYQFKSMNLKKLSLLGLELSDFILLKNIISQQNVIQNLEIQYKKINNFLLFFGQCDIKKSLQSFIQFLSLFNPTNLLQFSIKIKNQLNQPLHIPIEITSYLKKIHGNGTNLQFIDYDNLEIETVKLYLKKKAMVYMLLRAQKDRIFSKDIMNYCFNRGLLTEFTQEENIQ